MKQNNKKNIIWVLLLVVITFCVYLLFSNDKKVEIPAEIQTDSELPITQSDIKTQIKSVFIKESPLNENVKNVSTTLQVLDKSYSVKTEEGVSVYDVMKDAESDGFSFEGKEYPSMGFFVEKINEIKNGEGGYWIYYVNGIKASVGISNYIIKDGDIINWKFE